MLIELVRIEKGLSPVNDDDVKAIKKLEIGEHVFMEYKPRRNMKFHKKYWALLNAVIHNQQHYKNSSNLHESVKYRAGYFETMIPLKGEPFVKTKSIAFHSMDGNEFDKFYSVAIDVCVELVGDNAVEEIIRFN